MESFNCSGFWWLPSNPEKKIAGTLYFSTEEGIHLDLVGSFFGFFNIEFKEHKEQIPLILGVTDEKGEVTLSDCFKYHRSFSTSGLEIEKYEARLLFKGVHFTELDHLKFFEMQICYTYLFDWAKITGFAGENIFENNKFVSSSVQYSFPEEVVAETKEGKLALTHRFNVPISIGEKITLEQTTWFSIEPIVECDFDSLWGNFIYPLRNLLCLATNNPISIEKLLLRTNFYNYNDESDNKRFPEIELFFRNTVHKRKTERSLFEHEMFFQLSDIIDFFNEAIQKWFDAHKEIDSVCNLFFEVFHQPEMYLRHRFLNVAQAIETYHRKRRKNEVLPKKEHKQKISEIILKVDEQHQNWLKDQLAFSNEPRLRARVLELSTEAEEIISGFITTPEEFAGKVTKARNYLTHYGNKKDKPSNNELFLFTQTLLYLLQYCLLGEIGIPHDKRVEIFNRNERYKFQFRNLNLKD